MNGSAVCEGCISWSYLLAFLYIQLNSSTLQTLDPLYHMTLKNHDLGMKITIFSIYLCEVVIGIFP